MGLELLIGDETGSKAYEPSVEEGIEWTTERKGAAGKLTFKIVKDAPFLFSEGCAVRLRQGADNIFFGFIFKQQGSKNPLVTITAYDQLRYLKNKDTISYEGKTADQLLSMLAKDYGLKTGTLENTKYVIGPRAEENTSLFDMIQSALDATLMSTGEMYVLYDDFGKITLKGLPSMYVGSEGAYLMIDEETGENYDYTTSIDDNVYNQIKLAFDNESTGTREIYIAKDQQNINRWGLLQYFDTVKRKKTGRLKQTLF